SVYPTYPTCFTPMSTSPLFFFNDPATTEIYTLSLHDALPIFVSTVSGEAAFAREADRRTIVSGADRVWQDALSRGRRRNSLRRRSEEHTSELQSLTNLVCRLLLEKKNSLSMYDLDMHEDGRHC